jgi:pyruvate formate lyase activating enzyme
MHEAMFYEKMPDKKIKCTLCPNFCIIPADHVGKCKSRKNVSGILMAINYSRFASMGIDSIEKKPLYHYYPGSQILSLGANSCNLNCNYCQNYEISQNECATSIMQPEDLLDLVLLKNFHQIAFTYTEPFTWYEYIHKFGQISKDKGIRIILVTNGYINPEPLKEIQQNIDAMNIDLKSMSDNFYNAICGGKVTPVLETIKSAISFCHIEITNLLIPEQNDNKDELQELIDFLYSINPDIPVHFSRYFPCWESHQPVTPESTLLSTFNLARKKLKYVYLGNVPSGEYTNTYCPGCGKELISRASFASREIHIVDNKCGYCGVFIYGKF